MWRRSIPALVRVGKDILQTAGKSAAESAADGVIDNLTNGDSDNSQRRVPSHDTFRALVDG